MKLLRIKKFRCFFNPITIIALISISGIVYLEAVSDSPYGKTPLQCHAEILPYQPYQQYQPYQTPGQTSSWERDYYCRLIRRNLVLQQARVYEDLTLQQLVLKKLISDFEDVKNGGFSSRDKLIEETFRVYQNCVDLESRLCIIDEIHEMILNRRLIVPNISEEMINQAKTINDVYKLFLPEPRPNQFETYIIARRETVGKEQKLVS